jgi:hypothetical protein
VSPRVAAPKCASRLVALDGNSAIVAMNKRIVNEHEWQKEYGESRFRHAPSTPKPPRHSAEVAKYTGVLAAADIGEFTYTTTFQIMQSLRLDSGPSGPVHP